MTFSEILLRIDPLPRLRVVTDQRNVVFDAVRAYMGLPRETLERECVATDPDPAHWQYWLEYLDTLYRGREPHPGVVKVKVKRETSTVE